MPITEVAVDEPGSQRKSPTTTKAGGPYEHRQRQRQNGSAGNAHRSYERYVALAREATLNGDAVEADNYFQHAEHYFRVMRERTA